MTKYADLIAAYEIDVRFPDVSGLEHLDMLRVRSEIANCEADLTAEAKVRLRPHRCIWSIRLRQFFRQLGEGRRQIKLLPPFPGGGEAIWRQSSGQSIPDRPNF